MSSPTTVVTMYFNISEFSDATPSVRTKSFYMDKGRATLELDFPMVVYCDETCVEDIKALRGDRPTEYVVKGLAEYEYYKDNHPIIVKNRSGNGMYIDSRNTASHCLVTNFKFYAVHKAAQRNPFGTNHFAWVDFGGSHIMRAFTEYVPKMLAKPHPKIAFCYIHYRGHSELGMTDTFVRNGLCGAATTCFTLETSYATKLYTGCMSVLYEMFMNKSGHTDEQVLTVFYDRYPELCTLYYGDYYSIATNYHRVREDFPGIWAHFIVEAYHKNRLDLAKGCASAILKSVEEGVIGLGEHDVSRLRSV